MVGKVLEIGYVVVDPNDLTYFYQSNVGIFLRESNARKLCDYHNKQFGKKLKVVKVKLEIVEEK